MNPIEELIQRLRKGQLDRVTIRQAADTLSAALRVTEPPIAAMREFAERGDYETIAVQKRHLRALSDWRNGIITTRGD